MSRFQMDISQEGLDEIQTLMDSAGITTKKEFMNNAITLFTWALRERKKGNQIASIDDVSDIFREIEMPALNEMARRGRAQLSMNTPKAEGKVKS